MSEDAPRVDRNLLQRGAFYRRRAQQGVAVQRDELRQLVDAARAGDQAAFGAVFDHCYPAIYRYAYARLGKVADAEDAAAEAFASAFAALPRFRWRGAPFEAWLFRIAASKVTDSIRRQARAGEQPMAALDEADNEADPADLVADAEHRQQLLDAIERLPPHQREVVLLRFFGERSVQEVADIMGRSAGAVKQLQFRALARLTEMVER